MLNYRGIERERNRVIAEIQKSEFPDNVKRALIYDLRRIDLMRIYVDNIRKDYPLDYIQDTIIDLLKKKSQKALAQMDSVTVDYILRDIVFEALPPYEG